MLKQINFLMTYIKNLDQLKKNEIVIKIQKESFQSAPKKTVETLKSDGSELRSFVKEYFKSEGLETGKEHWITPNEVVLNDCSSLSLHSLTLQAEQLGKKISYSKSLTIKISE